MTIINLLPEPGEALIEFINIILSAIALGFALASLAIARGILASFFQYLVAGLGAWGLAELTEGLTLTGLLKIEIPAIHHGLELLAFIIIFSGFFRLYRLRDEITKEEQ